MLVLVGGRPPGESIWLPRGEERFSERDPGEHGPERLAIDDVQLTAAARHLGVFVKGRFEDDRPEIDAREPQRIEPIGEGFGDDTGRPREFERSGGAPAL